MKSSLRTLVFLPAFVAMACASPGDEPDEIVEPDPPKETGDGLEELPPNEEDPTPGDDQTVVVFDGEPVYYLAEDDRRTVDVEIDFPAAGLSYERITLNLDLRCPADDCDWWDRIGTIAIVEDAGTEDEVVTEVWRFITPYRLGASWNMDVTDLRPLLADRATVRVYISTGVGPGHANGQGWLVDASFDFEGGVPELEPIAVIPIWSLARVPYGDPAQPIEASVPKKIMAIPEDATQLVLRSFVTGHGQGNAGNCAEFCQKTHGFQVGDETFQQLLWRDDCPETAVPDQPGTWTYARAGWCPGAVVQPWEVDVTAAGAPGMMVALEYGVSDYENTCRPDANEAPTCLDCTLGSTCEYNGNNHTEPNYRFSAHVIAYR